MTTLRLDDVSHGFGDRVTLQHLTLSVEPGQVVALIGLNGAGKTTALRVLAGRVRPTEGEAEVLGHDPVNLPVETAARFGQMIGTPLVYPELTVTENLRCAARLHGQSRQAATSSAHSAVGRTGLGPWRHARARTLSAGNRQRLGIACATLHRPAALILDEPTSALDPRGVVLVRKLVRELADDEAAVLVSSHHLDEVARVADQLVVLHGGRDIGRLESGGTDLERRFFAMVLDADTHTTATGSPT